MSAKQKQAKEAKAPYRTKRQVTSPPARVILRWTEIEKAREPIILERNGKPVAVVIRYADYQQMDMARTERREVAWRELDQLLERVHARTQNLADAEVEADITAAIQEVREQRHALRRRS